MDVNASKIKAKEIYMHTRIMPVRCNEKNNITIILDLNVCCTGKNDYTCALQPNQVNYDIIFSSLESAPAIVQQ
jgi:hypothetical protein